MSKTRSESAPSKPHAEAPEAGQEPPSDVLAERERRARHPPTSFEAYRGDWAVVTGASRGLGMGYATALARRGMNTVLVARSAETLESLAGRLLRAPSHKPKGSAPQARRQWDAQMIENRLCQIRELHQAWLKGELLALSAREFQLLVALAKDTSTVVPKQVLGQLLEPLGDPVDAATVEVHLSNLRRKIGAERIRTVRGVGYQLRP